MKKVIATLVAVTALVAGSVSLAGPGPRSGTGGGRAETPIFSPECTTISLVECTTISSLE